MNSTDKSGKTNLHAGHRRRLHSRFENEGLLHFEEHNILELLLFYSIPRRDTNEIAHRLLNRFGSLHSVLTASPDELKKVDGIGPSSAAFLKLVFETAQHAQLQRLTEHPLSTFHQLYQIGIEWFADKPAESVMVMLLDENNRFLDFVPLSEEVAATPDCALHTILERARLLHAASLVIYHSHPPGETSPSNEDILSTRYLYQLLLKENLRLLDHLVISGLDAVSLFSSHRDFICRPDVSPQADP